MRVTGLHSDPGGRCAALCGRVARRSDATGQGHLDKKTDEGVCLADAVAEAFSRKWLSGSSQHILSAEAHTASRGGACRSRRARHGYRAISESPGGRCGRALCRGLGLGRWGGRSVGCGSGH